MQTLTKTENNMLLNLLLVCLMSVTDSVPSKTIRAIVVDSETKARLRDAIVTLDGRQKIMTCWDGSFVLKDSASLITISKRGYLQRKLNYKELKDTIELINDGKFLDEVVVIGHYRRPSMNFGQIATQAAAEAPRQSGIGFDMFATVDRIINYKKYKRRKKAKKVLEGY